MCVGTIPPIAAAVQSESAAGHGRDNPQARLFRRRREGVNADGIGLGDR
jgi:hypothetical protein